MQNDWKMTLLISLISFVIGNITGYCLHRFLEREVKQSNSTFIMFVVIIIWAVSTLADILNPIYETSPIVHGIVGTLVGFYFYRRKEGDK
jgi:predicted membrane channel-forming protein YqfA (hemolysin III family)